MAVIEFTSNNFDQEVLQSKDAVLVDFWAEWCGPCRMLAPTIQEIAQEEMEHVKVGKVNVDDQMQLASSYNVMSIPTVILFKDGKEVARSIGVKPKQHFMDLIDRS
ncbi:MAG: thioredoxin [Christensenellales bacterium]|jgi:thioredoxin 1